MLKFILKAFCFFIFGIVGGIFAEQILWPYLVERPLFYQYKLEQVPIFLTEKKEIIIQENVALQNAVERVEKTIIGVKTETPTGKIIQGSGLVLTSDGMVITLAELIPQGSKFSFFVGGKMVSYQVIKRDLKENLALIKLEQGNLPVISFADLDRLKLGTRVFLVALIFEKNTPSLCVNEGIVKTFNAKLIETNIFEKDYVNGSPLFNIEGQLLGLNVLDSEGKVTTIPVSKIRSFAGF